MATILVAKLILKEHFLTSMFVFAHQGNCLFPSLFLCSLAFPERKRLGEWVGAQSPPNAPPFILPTFAAVIDKVTEIHFYQPIKT